MSNPKDLRYTKEHEWIKVEGTEGPVGITDFAQSELGELVFVELPPIGKSIKAGESLCVVESTKAASDVYSPVSGVVKEVNTAVATDPTLINSAPYEGGWLVRLEKIENAEVEKLMTAADYDSFLAQK